MRSPVRTATPASPPSAEGLVFRAVLFSVVVRGAFLLLFALLAFVSFVFIPGSGSFVGIYFFGGTFLLPILVPAFVFVRTRHKAMGSSGAPTWLALLAAGLALFVTVVPVPGTGPTALKYASPLIERKLSHASYMSGLLTRRPREWLGRALSECRSSSDCKGEGPTPVCASTGFRNVCVATTEADPSSGCPQGWICVETSPDINLYGSTPYCVPAGDASRFGTASGCKATVRRHKSLRSFGENSAD